MLVAVFNSLMHAIVPHTHHDEHAADHIIGQLQFEQGEDEPWWHALFDLFSDIEHPAAGDDFTYYRMGLEDLACSDLNTADQDITKTVFLAASTSNSPFGQRLSILPSEPPLPPKAVQNLSSAPGRGSPV